MKTTLLIASILLASVSAIKFKSANTGKGIFSGMIAEVEQDSQIDGEIQAARDRKK